MADIPDVLSADKLEELRAEGYWVAPWDLTADQLADLSRHKADNRWWAVTRDMWLRSKGLPNV